MDKFVRFLGCLDFSEMIFCRAHRAVNHYFGRGQPVSRPWVNGWLRNMEDAYSSVSWYAIFLLGSFMLISNAKSSTKGQQQQQDSREDMAATAVCRCSCSCLMNEEKEQLEISRTASSPSSHHAFVFPGSEHQYSARHLEMQEPGAHSVLEMRSGCQHE